MTSTESIMVCVYYGPNGERLINRGIQLARMLNAPLWVLTVDSGSGETYSPEQEKYFALWKRLSRDAGAQFAIEKCNDRRPSQAIVDAARHRGITQIIIGQSGQTRWQEITKGTFINELLNRIGAIDLHIVAVQRMNEDPEQSHDKGTGMFLVKTAAGYELSEAEAGEECLPGTFFRELHTDFDNGLFKLEIDGEYRYLHIHQGKLADSPPYDGK